jgi:hypothetical protein
MLPPAAKEASLRSDMCRLLYARSGEPKTQEIQKAVEHCLMDLHVLLFSLRFLFFWFACSDEGADKLSIDLVLLFG